MSILIGFGLSVNVIIWLIWTSILQALHEVETVADATNEHPLALLAEQSKKLLQKEATMFMPILSQRHPQAIVVSASLLHRLYGNKLVSLYWVGWVVNLHYSSFANCVFEMLLRKSGSWIKLHLFRNLSSMVLNILLRMLYRYFRLLTALSSM